MGSQSVSYCLGIGIVTSDSGLDALAGKGLENEGGTTDIIYFQYTRSGNTYPVGYAIVF